MTDQGGREEQCLLWLGRRGKRKSMLESVVTWKGSLAQIFYSKWPTFALSGNIGINSDINQMLCSHWKAECS